ncbi:MAG: glycosyltransferase family 39 protein [Candidatus Diapherotrites archaeon]|uniref:Glycosyltransferase family 39 protein n=1 Tax=Candidatus Iainarchaeum sp. TaxID=3101447 RepID=A0A938YRY4_9ARCH|nr:glycosyltransferase family 39 protein [Candidatus Diapherotrites archaeon]
MKLGECKAFLKSNPYKALLALLIIAYLAFNISLLNYSEVMNDEAAYAWQSLVIYKSPAKIMLPEVNYPYYAVIPAMAAPFNLFMKAEATTRLVSVIFGAITLVFTFLIGKEIFGERTGLIAAAMLSVSPTFWFFAAKGLFDMPSAGLTAIGVYLILTINRKRSMLLALGTFAMYFVKTTNIVFVPLVIAGFSIKKKIRPKPKKLAMAIAAVGVLAAIAVIFSPQRLGWVFELNYLQKNYLHYLVFFSNQLMLNLIGLYFVPLCILGIRKVSGQFSRKVAILEAWIFFIMVPFFIIGDIVPRYLLPAVPALMILGAVGFEEAFLKKGYWRAAASIAIPIMLFSYAPAYFFSPYFGMNQQWVAESNGYGKLGTWLSENVDENSIVFIFSKTWAKRWARFTVEQSIPNAEEQMVIAPKKEEFEGMIGECDRGYFLLLDYRTFKTHMDEPWEDWLFDLNNWQGYLQEQGFGKVKEIRRDSNASFVLHTVYSKECG